MVMTHSKRSNDLHNHNYHNRNSHIQRKHIQRKDEGIDATSFAILIALVIPFIPP